MRISQASAIPFAPPARVPFRAATDRQGRTAMADDSSSHRGDVANPARAASKSAPAENTRPAPVMINPRADWASRAISRRSVNMSGVRLLALSGRLMVTVQTPVSDFVKSIIAVSYVCAFISIQWRGGCFHRAGKFPCRPNHRAHCHTSTPWRGRAIRVGCGRTIPIR